jgi:hypothetical protein
MKEYFCMDNLGFAEMLWPTPIKEFSQRYFDSSPLRLIRARSGYYTGLISLQDIDRFLSFVRPPFAKAFAIDSRRAIEPSEYADTNGLADASRLFGLYESGATIVLREIEDNFPKLGALCRSAEKHLSSPFVANVYLAPPGGQSFPIHFDAKDVYVLQIAGSKNWRLYRPQYPLPLSYQHCYDGMRDEGFLEEFDLQSGDFLYCPRGFPHLVRATESSSLHVSLSTFPYTWADVMKRAFVNLCESDPLFRASLPPDFTSSHVDLQRTFTALTERFHRAAEWWPALNAIKREFVGSRPARITNSRLLHQQSASLSLESEIRPSPDLLYLIDIEQGVVRLTGLGKDIRFDLSVSEDLIYALKTPHYKIGDTPGALGSDAKLDLFRTLFLNGFVTTE